MKKPVLIGASLVLATSISILGACGKESTSASGESSNQQIALSQVSKVTVNGKRLSEKEVKQYKDEYMQDTRKKLTQDNQSVIKNIILKEELMKDLGVTQEQLEKEFSLNAERVKNGPKGVTVSSKGLILHESLVKAYAKKYLSSDDTLRTLSDSFKGEKKESFISMTDMIPEDKDTPGTYNLPFNYYNLFLFYNGANKHNEAEVLKYQQNLLEKADVKGIKLSKLKTGEAIF
ncbi:hypothetical protein [Priestia megaterium]|uniref:Lipoprotein n=1 Tax=Priestia megaterium TaxID=1404 RepID=A0A6M6E448_PRIMG|nr:hypothetical protein [Priestia megaterium]QJX80446.1 hypothetical protein FDZ14_30630 [Priestia megaterium]